MTVIMKTTAITIRMMKIMMSVLFEEVFVVSVMFSVVGDSVGIKHSFNNLTQFSFKLIF